MEQRKIDTVSLLLSYCVCISAFSTAVCAQMDCAIALKKNLWLILFFELRTGFNRYVTK